ncbi:hypothetical protein QBC37DRAFT_194573 [Rhypophila decipiens]|uniref:N-acetyltransferase domain-containing protein n=1 Tax=Rhypophila decipiens TaxID=261697 RepID=A0AAN7B4G0_9PEZI|nr:hypothetical protein QBC37DRAFT_194573 [Rhypophila decipiens]
MDEMADKDSRGWTDSSQPSVEVPKKAHDLDLDSQEAQDRFLAAAAQFTGLPKKSLVTSEKQHPNFKAPTATASRRTYSEVVRSSRAPSSADRKDGVMDNTIQGTRPLGEISHNSRPPQHNTRPMGQKQPHLWESFVPPQSAQRCDSRASRPNMLTATALAATNDATIATNQEEVAFSPHLNTLQLPRRGRGDRDQDGSSPRGLSDTSSIRCNSGYVDPDPDGSGGNPRSDIRNAIAPVHQFQDYGDRWVKVNWDGGRRDHCEDNTIFCSDTYIGRFIVHWMQDAASNIQVNLDMPNHWNSDIETETGRLLMPIEQPETTVDPTTANNDAGWNFRREKMTSKMMMAKRMSDDGRKAKHQSSRRNPNGKPNWKDYIRAPPATKDPAPTPTPPTYHSSKIIKVIPHAESSAPPSGMGSVIGADVTTATTPPIEGKGKYALGPRSNFSPAVPCYLRPALKNDMNAVTEIYNYEVTQGKQALDSSPLTANDFTKILETTQTLGMPFIVAVRGSARTIRAEKGNFELSPFLQRSPYLADPEDARQNGVILGFAYLSVWEPGLAGDGNGSSRASARVNVFVDPKFRRKKVGLSLLDKLLSTVSRRYTSLQSYDFVDLSNSLVYKHPLGHERQYFRLYLTYFVRHAHNLFSDDPEFDKEQDSYRDDLVWVKKLLEKIFGFEEKFCFETSHRSSNYIKSRPIYWLDSVVFEHTCHLDARFTNEY